MARSNRLVVAVGRQSGLSIIEIMIALLLGALLTVGLVQVFTSNSQSFRVNEATARAQETGRMSVDMLARALRNAGYFGCFPVNGIVNNLDTTDSDYDPAIHEFRLEGIFSEAASRPAQAVAGTDWFLVTGLRSGGVNLQSTGQINSASFTINQRGDLAVGDEIMVSDCNNGDIFEISNIQQGGGNGVSVNVVANSGNGAPGNDFSGNAPAGCNSGSNCLSALYPAGAQVLIPYNETYFIGTGASGNRALFSINSRINPGVPIELVDGVEDMAVRYGTGTAENGVTAWQDDADLIADWSTVIAVEVSLLVRSGQDNVLDQAITACFPSWTDCAGGNNYIAPDNGLYRVYSFTTALRNRI